MASSATQAHDQDMTAVSVQQEPFTQNHNEGPQIPVPTGIPTTLTTPPLTIDPNAPIGCESREAVPQLWVRIVHETASTQAGIDQWNTVVEAALVQDYGPWRTMVLGWFEKILEEIKLDTGVRFRMQMVFRALVDFGYLDGSWETLSAGEGDELARMMGGLGV